MSELSEISARDAEVSSLLTKKDKAAAMNVALQNPPVSSKSEEAKDANLAVIEKVLAVLNDADITSIISGLNIELADTLMKYIYKLFAKTSSKEKPVNYAQLLKIHAQLVQRAGLGSIVKAMTDRKQV
eukprot:gene7914-10742_t